MTATDTPTVLLTGATGFVGRHLYPHLEAAGAEVVCASRRPERASTRYPDRRWVRLDVTEPASIAEALRGCQRVVYLVHAMGDGEGYAARERDAARALRDAAEAEGVESVVYLGGVCPEGEPSPHLASRLETGRILRSGRVPATELRAGMIIGEGSESWRICRDLASRLPFMILPQWLRSRSEPVAIADVVAALGYAVLHPPKSSAWYDIPGPEQPSVEEILMRVAAMRGIRPLSLRVPVLTPKLSSYWLRLVSGADFTVARELVAGLTGDLISSGPSYFAGPMDGYAPSSFDEAVRAALEAGRGARRGRMVEGLVRLLSLSPREPAKAPR